MKVALLICAKPIDTHVGHAVYVPGGAWRAKDDCIDTDYSLLISSPNIPGFIVTDKNAPIRGPVIAKVNISSKGSEKIINIHLERIGD